jgi:hypothetical protein
MSEVDALLDRLAAERDAAEVGETERGDPGRREDEAG